MRSGFPAVAVTALCGLVVASVMLLCGSRVVWADESRYFYDDLGRLVKVERDSDGVAVYYTYDAVGNRLNRTIIHDLDFDGSPDAEDCAPSDGGAFAEPTEVTGLAFTDKQTMIWSSALPTAGLGTVHDVLKGFVNELPVGSPEASETCLAPGISESTAQDPADPTSGASFWYLVRAQNVCAVGTYGFESDSDERISGACP